jgi:hypothetical protein
VKCSKCRAENLADSSFCAECGAKIEVTCAAYGAAHPPAAMFCRKCGERIGCYAALELREALRGYADELGRTAKHVGFCALADGGRTIRQMIAQ